MQLSGFKAEIEVVCEVEEMVGRIFTRNCSADWWESLKGVAAGPVGASEGVWIDSDLKDDAPKSLAGANIGGDRKASEMEPDWDLLCTELQG